MIRRPVNPDSVAAAGAAIGLLSCFLGWLTLKPNRLAEGTSLSLWGSLGWGGAAAIIGLWLLCLIVSLRVGGKRGVAAPGIAANIILVVSFILIGATASRVVSIEGSLTRVSLSAGVWTTILAVYMLIFASRRRLNGSSLLRNLVSSSGLLALVVLLFSGWLDNLSVMRELAGWESRFQQELVHHIFLFGSSVAVGALIGVSLGTWAARNRYVEKPIFFIVNITQTIPSLALFGLLIAPLSALSFAHPTLREIGIRGVGTTPALIALIIYSLLPIVRNTYVGLRQLDPAVIDAGRGMGMGRGQVFRRLEVPLAAPIVLEGVRTASVQSVGLAAVAALIGAGGLGWFVFEGLGQSASDLIILGAIPIIILAVLVDAVMRIFVRLATPKGLVGEVK